MYSAWHRVIYALFVRVIPRYSPLVWLASSGCGVFPAKDCRRGRGWEYAMYPAVEVFARSVAAVRIPGWQVEKSWGRGLLEIHSIWLPVVQTEPQDCT